MSPFLITESRCFRDVCLFFFSLSMIHLNSVCFRDGSRVVGPWSVNCRHRSMSGGKRGVRMNRLMYQNSWNYIVRFCYSWEMHLVCKVPESFNFHPLFRILTPRQYWVRKTKADQNIDLLMLNGHCHLVQIWITTGESSNLQSSCLWYWRHNQTSDQSSSTAWAFMNLNCWMSIVHLHRWPLIIRLKSHIIRQTYICQSIFVNSASLYGPQPLDINSAPP